MNMKKIWMIAGGVVLTFNVFAADCDSVDLAVYQQESEGTPRINRSKGRPADFISNVPSRVSFLMGDDEQLYGFADSITLPPGRCKVDATTGASIAPELEIQNRSATKTSTVQTANTNLTKPLVIPSSGGVYFKFNNNTKNWDFVKVYLQSDPLPPGAIPSGPVSVK